MSTSKSIGKTEKAYDDVTQYLANNPGVSVKKACKATGVNVSNYYYGKKLVTGSMGSSIRVGQKSKRKGGARASKVSKSPAWSADSFVGGVTATAPAEESSTYQYNLSISDLVRTDKVIVIIGNASQLGAVIRPFLGV